MTFLPQSQSPDDLNFASRRKSFDLGTCLASDWHGGSAFRTAWFNAMSLLFPLGEKFFIDSVCHFQDEIADPRLQDEIAAFRAQEATHRVQHQKYNELLCELRDYDLPRFEKDERERMAWAYRELSARRRLAGTVANEHLTAIMANDMLMNQDILTGADPQVANLWEWHGVEETEHKAVAFDVFVAVGGTVSERRQALLLEHIFLFQRYAAQRLHHVAERWQALEPEGMGKRFPVIFSSNLACCAVYSLPGSGSSESDFHPWQLDNRELIRHWEQRQDTATVSIKR